MHSLTVEAPAKLNLTLDILRRRPDGYHEMRMVMGSISLCDRVTVEPVDDGFVLRARGVTLPSGRVTMEQRAAEAFFTALHRPMPGLVVTLEKQIPAYAGLGGGSSDVAALLRALRQLYAPEMPTAELERIGLQVGSDVPYCVRGGTCLAEGRGEILTDLPSLPPCPVVVCKPDIDLPTAQLFARVRPESISRRPDSQGMLRAMSSGSLEAVARQLCNVFEEVLPAPAEAEVRTIKRQMIEQGALNAAMSGSGPTVFGLFSDSETARRAFEALQKDYRQTFLAQIL